MQIPDPNDFDFSLPKALIAQEPAAERAGSRLMMLNRQTGDLSDHHFADIVTLLPEGALVVVNNTRVIPARLVGTRPTGGRVEVFLLQPEGEGDVWRALVRPSARVRPGMLLTFGEGLVAKAIARGEGHWTVALSGPAPVEQLIEAVGRMPLPPYIQRTAGESDKERYQTIFARERGAVAAPTAGLHFTPTVLDALAQRGVDVERITLHVGAGTFAPLREEQLRSGRLHAERYRVTPEAFGRIKAAKEEGRPVVAVGTTVVRTLETLAQQGDNPSLEGSTEIFITPGFEFRWVDHLITNFHLPRSSLLMLVAAFAGRERTLQAYNRAVSEGYRFYSYGDATFIL